MISPVWSNSPGIPIADPRPATSRPLMGIVFAFWRGLVGSLGFPDDDIFDGESDEALRRRAGLDDVDFSSENDERAEGDELSCLIPR